MASTALLLSTRILRRICASCTAPGRRRLTTLGEGTAPIPPYRVLLLGADDFSCHTLTALHFAPSSLIEKITVITPPDSKTGRRLKEIYRPPLRILAEKFELETISLPPHEGLKNFEVPTPFDFPSPSNILLTASFAHLIPNRILSLFAPLNTLNVHPSLLPKYRGAAPIQWSIINGERRTGVTIQELSRGKFDQGRILGQVEREAPENSTFQTLEPILAKDGADLLLKVLSNFVDAQVNAITQDSSLATLAPKLTKEHAMINWHSDPEELIRLQRGLSHHFPLSTFFVFDDLDSSFQTVQVLVAPTSTIVSSKRFSSPGQFDFDPVLGSLLVCCGEDGTGIAIVSKVKIAGGKWIEGRDFWLNCRRKNVYEQGELPRFS